MKLLELFGVNACLSCLLFCFLCVTTDEKLVVPKPTEAHPQSLWMEPGVRVSFLRGRNCQNIWSALHWIPSLFTTACAGYRSWSCVPTCLRMQTKRRWMRWELRFFFMKGSAFSHCALFSMALGRVSSVYSPTLEWAGFPEGRKCSAMELSGHCFNSVFQSFSF